MFKVKRIITPGKIFEELMDNFILLDSYETPMLVKPVDWDIGFKNFKNSGLSDKTVKYGGYLYKDKEDFEDLIYYFTGSWILSILSYNIRTHRYS